MPITACRLYLDTLNFFRHQFSTLCLLVLFTTLISLILNQLFTMGGADLSIFSGLHSSLTEDMNWREIIKEMTPEQHIVLLKLSIAASLSGLIGNVVLLGGMLVLIPLISTGNDISASRVIYGSVLILPRLLLLMFLCTLMVQVGATLFIVPGIVLAVGLSMAPLIIYREGLGIFSAIYSSFHLAFANVSLISPAIMLWFALKLVIMLFLRSIPVLHPMIIMFIMGLFNHFVSTLLIIYLSRLYMLLKQNT
ncbi:YciC family protein [Candidatus Profftia tarda]|uniref:UPF0259 membrane protein PROFFT_A_02270 n=1 Tax=Candidatus Profftia tarda TaxID=1177216 RepID=A0A8E4GHR4_9ENTR|nr:YciC family protein [Candidatus Profftia tarda]CAD6509066.1 UPF0259 membrane protein Spro_2675 [Candidatus Profftia tarda]